MKEYFKKLITAIITVAIFIGIPVIIGDWSVMIFSWIPALIIMGYLSE